MIIKKKSSPKGEWAKVGEDINNGDVVTIVSDGEEAVGDYGKRLVFKIKTRNGEKNLSFNQTTLNALVDAYGEDSSLWIGKRANVYVIKSNVSGRFMNVVYLVGIGWELTDSGKIEKKGGSPEVDGESVPDVDVPGVTIDDIPF